MRVLNPRITVLGIISIFVYYGEVGYTKSSLEEYRLDLGDIAESSVVQTSAILKLRENIDFSKATIEKSCGCIKNVNILNYSSIESSVKFEFELNTVGKAKFNETIALTLDADKSNAKQIIVHVDGIVKQIFSLPTDIISKKEFLLHETSQHYSEVTIVSSEDLKAASNDPEILDVNVERKNNKTFGLRVKPSTERVGTFLSSIKLYTHEIVKNVPIIWSVRHPKAQVSDIPLGIIEKSKPVPIEVLLNLGSDVIIQDVALENGRATLEATANKETSTNETTIIHLALRANKEGAFKDTILVKTKQGSTDDNIHIAVSALVMNFNKMHK